MALPVIDTATIRSLTSERSYFRGVEYCEGGCVSKVVESSKSYYANVYGHRRYSVRIYDDGGRINTSCTCRYGAERVCRHAVAVMVALASGGRDTPFNWYEQGRLVDEEPGELPSDLPDEIAEEADAPAPSKRSRVILASEVMNAPVVSLSPDADLVEAWKLLCEKRFRHVPVVSEEGKLLGIVSDRDILLRAALISASETAHQARPGGAIGEIMRTRVLTASPTTEIRQIARVFFQERIGAMPVVNERGNLVGMITRSDVLRSLIDRDQIWL